MKLIKQILYLHKNGALEGYFFTQEELNQYTQKVIKQALDNAAEKVEHLWDSNENELFDIDKESITDTFEETYNKFKL